MLRAVFSSSPLKAPRSVFGQRRTQPQRSTPVAIAASDLDMVYNADSQPFQALKSIELTVPTGAIQMVVGPSGAGKTTLLLILAGLLTPTRGRIVLLGEEVSQFSRQQLDQFRLQHLGIMFQESNLLRSLTALENVEAALWLKGMQGPAARRTAQALLEDVGLGDRTDHLPRQLSGGQQQRVAVARALAGDPALIIADEPTASLDSRNGRLVVESMRQLAKEKGSTVLIATHDPRILQFADRIVYLNDGVLSDRDPQ